MIQIRPASLDDAEAITAIYNQGIAQHLAAFETQPCRVADIRERINNPRFPILVAVDHGKVVGWAGLSIYRPRECYSGVAEFSFYVETISRGHGIGTRLLSSLIDAARKCGFWKLVSRVFTFNRASRAVCRTAGFREVGVYEKHSQLDGRWLDVVIVERLIPENLTIASAATK